MPVTCKDCQHNVDGSCDYPLPYWINMGFDCPDYEHDCDVHTPRLSPFQASDLPYVVINGSTHFKVRDRSKGEIWCTHGDWTGTLRQDGAVQYLVVHATGYEIEVHSLVPTAAKTLQEYANT